MYHLMNNVKQTDSYRRGQKGQKVAKMEWNPKLTYKVGDKKIQSVELTRDARKINDLKPGGGGGKEITNSIVPCRCAN